MRASHWSEKRAEDFCLSVRDGTHDSPKPTAYGKKLITSKNIIGSHISLENSYRISIEDAEKVDKRSLVEQWDVLISMIGTVGEVCLIKEKPDFSIKNIGLFKSKGKEEGVYLYYYLKSQLAKNYIENRLAGSTQKYISLTELRNIPIKYPKNREEMCAINYVLSYLDDKIDLNRRTNETLEAMARALFRDWFVDFGPTRAKMAGEAPYLAPEVWELFPDMLDDEGKPEGWEVRPTGDYIKNLDSRRVPLSSAQRRIRQGKYPYYGAASIVDYIDDYIFNGTYLLVGEDGTVQTKSGNPVTQYVHGKIWVNNHAHVLQGDNGVSTEHLLLHFSYVLIEPYITGAVQPKVSQKNMNSIPFIFSSENINSHFQKAVESFFNKILTNEAEARNLARLRDLLLPKLMSGEISIRDAEKMVDNAA
ncbi:restriction endonuclease subunit S [Acetobacter ascendens]|nr:restriction endonuclease subunit S [Acetobacter ascendens]